METNRAQEAGLQSRSGVAERISLSTGVIMLLWAIYVIVNYVYSRSEAFSYITSVFSHGRGN